MEDFTYSDVRNPAWAIRSEGVNLTGRMWLWVEVLFNSGPQQGRWSAMVIEHDNTQSAAQNEIYSRVVAGEFGDIAAAPPDSGTEAALADMHSRAAAKRPCINF